MKRKTLTAIGIGLAAAGMTLGLSAAAAGAGSAGAVAVVDPAQDSSDNGGSDETPPTGSDLEKATTAALAAVPGGTVIRVETDNDGGYEAIVQKTDGTQVVVAMDEHFTVTAVNPFDSGHGDDGGDPGQAGSTAELATSAGIRPLEGYGQHPVLHSPEVRSLTDPGSTVESP